MAIAYYILTGPFNFTIYGSQVYMGDLEKPAEFIFIAAAILLASSQAVVNSVKRSFCAMKPLTVAGITLIIYSMCLLTFLRQNDYQAISLAHIGEAFCDKGCQERERIPNLTKYGYDGQFFYRLSLDPLMLKPDLQPKLDSPAYRQQRIFYPALVHALSLGGPALVPWMMAAVNLFALAALAFLGARFMENENQPTSLGLAFPLYVGFYVSILRDLPEPLAILLVAMGLMAARANKYFWAATLLSLAVLTRETTLIVAVAIFISYSISKISANRKVMAEPPLYVALAPIFTYVAMQLLIYVKYGVFSIQQSNGNFDYPFFSVYKQVLGYLGGIHPHYTSHDIPLLAAYLITGAIALSVLATTNAPRHNKIAFLLYFGFVVCYGDSIMMHKYSYTRAMSEFYFFSMLAITGSRAWMYVAPAWILSPALLLWI